ncbi:MAG TPA: mandelate racemase/muconate lactonizing enzyme family protein [Thermomicrobiales bacterium]|nr:mandelate racemase/muconate lactonizing enzyme family protein [Thermomicrobiales bacterium]
MRVTQIETLRLDEFPNILFTRVHTDEGMIGLGETFYGARAVEAYIHETVAPYLLGQDPLEIDRHARGLYGYFGYRSSGAEMRGNSAIDIALWDLFGKATGQPIYQLLGGRSRDAVRVYNTCAGYRYVRNQPRQAVENWGLPQQDEGPYEDLEGFLSRADEVAESLLSEGITGMKIWPFDAYAERSNGQYISLPDLDMALEPFRKIRAAVGNRIDIMVELHSLWSFPAARQICAALEPFQPAWFEDPVKADSIDVLAELASQTRVPIAASETLATRWSYREVLEKKAAGIVMVDVSWTGGISEARKIASLAESHQRPVMFHDCTGPIVLTASTHLSTNAPNALIQEMVRAFYHGWYGELVTVLPEIRDGMITPPPGPGLGTELLPDLWRRPDATVVVSGEEVRTWGGTDLDLNSNPASGDDASAVMPGDGSRGRVVNLLQEGRQRD